MGTIKEQITVGPSEHEAECHVMDVPATFNLLLGRPRLHQIKVVSSTLHQLVKYPYGRGIATFFGNSSIHPPPEVITPLLEIQHGGEDVFLSGFTLAEAQLVQTLVAEDEGVYVSAQSIYFMSKLGHIPGMGLGQSGRKGITTASEVPHNPHAFGLGYAPMADDWKRKTEEIRERIKAKRIMQQFELVHKPIHWTLNGRFVHQGEDFPFCGFPEPWIDQVEKKRYPGFEIFFDH
ncbi:hypothetical protein CsSME_00027165 [Camellia sinensis var. sinensis]